MSDHKPSDPISTQQQPTSAPSSELGPNVPQQQSTNGPISFIPTEGGALGPNVPQQQLAIVPSSDTPAEGAALGSGVRHSDTRSGATALNRWHVFVRACMIIPKSGLVWCTRNANPLASMIVAVAALWVAWLALDATQKSLRQSNMATIYTLGSELTKADEERPGLSRYFDAEARKNNGFWLTEKEFWEAFDQLPEEQQTVSRREEYAQLWKDFCCESKEDRVRIYMACMRIGDFTQIAFMQRKLMPKKDWNTWWNYFTDQYDESPFYRVYLTKKRPRWYAFLTEITPKHREEQKFR